MSIGTFHGWCDNLKKICQFYSIRIRDLKSVILKCLGKIKQTAFLIVHFFKF